MTRPRTAHIGLGSALLALVATACPLSPAGQEALSFQCQGVEDCEPGFVCDQNRCVRAGQAGVDASALDLGRVDAPVRDRATPDVERADAARVDAAAVDGGWVDAAVPDGAGPDATRLDTANLDAAELDAADLDAADLDAAPLDADPGLDVTTVEDSAWPADARGLDVSAATDAVGLDTLAFQDATLADSSAALDAVLEDSALPGDAALEDRGPVEDAALEDAALEDAALEDAALEDAALEDAALEDATIEDATLEDCAPVTDAGLPDAAEPDAGCVRPGLWFDGVDDRVVVSGADDLDSAQAFTVEAWILPLVEDLLPGVEAVIVSQHDPASRDGYELRLRDGWLEFIVDDSAGSQPYGVWAAFAEDQRLRPGRWAHVTGVLERSGNSWMYLFVDGQLQRLESEPALSVRGTGQALHIGAPVERSCCQFAGAIDQVRISDRARYTAPFGPPLDTLEVDVDTLALWSLDEGSGQQVLDSTALSRHGTRGADDQVGDDDPTWTALSCVVDRPTAVLGDAGSEDVPPDAAAPPPDCDTLYGAAAGYVFCEQAATVCEFSATTGGGNCETLCESYGGSCVAAFDNADEPCERRAYMADTCQTNRSSEICVCTRN